jgi:hypothetical protein
MPLVSPHALELAADRSGDDEADDHERNRERQGQVVGPYYTTALWSWLLAALASFGIISTAMPLDEDMMPSERRAVNFRGAGVVASWPIEATSGLDSTWLA